MGREPVSGAWWHCCEVGLEQRKPSPDLAVGASRLRVSSKAMTNSTAMHPNLDGGQLLDAEMQRTGLSEDELRVVGERQQAESQAELERLVMLDGDA